MNELELLRAKIRETDIALRELFLRRCNLAVQVGKYKKEHHLPVLDLQREAENRKALTEAIDTKEDKERYEAFLNYLMKVAKELQYD